MKKTIRSFLIFIFLIFLITACSVSHNNKNIVHSVGKNIMLETVFGDNDPIKLINSVDIIIRGKIEKAFTPYYNTVGFPFCDYEISVDEIYKGSDLVSVEQKIILCTASGYVPFSVYAETEDKKQEINLLFSADEIEQYKSDPNAVVASYFQESVIPEEGNEYIFLLQSYEFKDSNNATWRTWTERSCIMELNGEEITGYATSLFGNTVSEFIQMVNKAAETPDDKYGE